MVLCVMTSYVISWQVLFQWKSNLFSSLQCEYLLSSLKIYFNWVNTFVILLELKTIMYHSMLHMFLMEQYYIYKVYYIQLIMYMCNIHYIGATLKTDVNIPNITYYDLLIVCLYSVYVSYHIIIQTFISFLKVQW